MVLVVISFGEKKKVNKNKHKFCYVGLCCNCKDSTKRQWLYHSTLFHT